MAVKLTTTREAAHLNGVKILVYGPAGSGKTRLCATAPKPVIVSAEAGLLSLRDSDIPVLTINSFDDVGEAFEILSGKEGEQFETICVDSISEIAEACLAAEKTKTEHAMRAYGEMAERMVGMVKAFRDLSGKHVYFSAKSERTKDEAGGGLLYGPSTPGQKLAAALPYLFDEVFALRVETTAEGEVQHWLQTESDGQYVAKDRSGALEHFVEPNLSTVINAIQQPLHKAA